ncbi:uncharacterized protein LOC101239471 isoform X2 [Hydra vulgaris]|uniref:Uncharacterized protein LOC101239471 isoform X2 n=1 Tax=Hydra vulgaris TaxID=6087 RepID=A0ABM4CWC9_HYDVU
MFRRAFLIKIIWILILFNEDSCKRPPRIDLGFVIDTSMNADDGKRAIHFVEQLLEHFSISPGTTRVALYTVDALVTKNFRFKTHVNRECVYKALKKVDFSEEDKTDDFQLMLTAVFEDFEVQSRDVINQRRIYIFVTNAPEEIKLIEKSLKIKLSENDFFGAVLIAKDTFFDFESLRFKTISYYNKLDIPKILVVLNVNNTRYGVCQNDGPFTDECKRQCTCKNKKIKDCYRVRKEFTSMTTKERKRYLKAYKTLTSQQPYKSIYERFIFMHFKYFCWGVHKKDLFLPWHRWFITTMEDLLTQIDCRVTLSYWDWSYVSEDPWNRTTIWRSTDDGLGGNGNRRKGYCVQSGMFRESKWETPYWEDPMEIIMSSADQIYGEIEGQYAHLAYCLRRGFKGKSPSRKSVLRTLALPPHRFEDFDIQMRHNYHDRMHNIIGGTMSTHYAANAPEFFLHHAFLDKIWYTWQSKSSKHKFVHFLQRNETKMMGCGYTPKQYINADNLPRCTKIKYEPFPLNERQKRNEDDIDDMARKPTKYWQKYLKESWYGNFPSCKRSDAERKRANYLHKTLDL